MPIVPYNITPAFPEAIAPEDIRDKLLELLGLYDLPLEVPYAVGPITDMEGIESAAVTFVNSLGEDVPGVLMYAAGPKQTSVPGIVCMPGTSGTAEEIAAGHMGAHQETGRLLGWGRELARRGYTTLAITIKGCVARRESAERWEQEAKFLVAYGRPQMGIIAEEALRAARVLAAVEGVDDERLGLTGMSLGGLASWYAMACAPWIKVGVPICGGIGSMASNILHGLPDRSSSAIYVPHMLRYFDHPDIVAACIAPRPFMTIIPTEDEDMPQQGAEALIRQVEPVYRGRRCADRFVVRQPPGNHRFTPEFFTWMAKWFDQNL